MTTRVIVPQLGLTVTEVTIIEWLVGDGSVTTEGDPLVTLATDKVEQEIPAPASGTVRHRAAVEDIVQVGELMCEIE